MQSYHFLRQPPLSTPPMAQLPDPTSDPGWYGELFVRYPLNQTISDTYFGPSTKAKGEFYAILNDIAVDLFSNPHTQLSLEKSLVYQNRLETWFDALPEPLQPNKIVLPSHLKLQ
jgi:hypothetical protein